MNRPIDALTTSYRGTWTAILIVSGNLSCWNILSTPRYTVYLVLMLHFILGLFCHWDRDHLRLASAGETLGKTDADPRRPILSAIPAFNDCDNMASLVRPPL